jgi:hypothetical protein
VRQHVVSFLLIRIIGTMPRNVSLNNRVEGNAQLAIQLAEYNRMDVKSVLTVP